MCQLLSQVLNTSCIPHHGPLMGILPLSHFTDENMGPLISDRLGIQTHAELIAKYPRLITIILETQQMSLLAILAITTGQPDQMGKRLIKQDRRKTCPFVTGVWWWPSGEES